MRHQNRVKKMNRTKSHRKALFMNLANALFDHESIQTTNPKAMELKKVADRLITLAKKKDLHSLRLVFAFLRDKKVVRKLFSDIGDRYVAINGGYTRVVKIGRRKGDAAPMAIIELTQKKEPEKEPEKGKGKAKAVAKAKKEIKEAKETKTKEPKEKKEKAPAKKKAVGKDTSDEAKPKRTRKPKAEKKTEEAKPEEA